MFQFGEIPNLRHLRMLQVIGRTGGVTCASRELSTSQPAVTQAVANLETDIGTPIFERSATGTYPTPLGKRYLLRVDRFFSILDTAIGQIISPPDGAIPRADWLMTNTQMRALIITSETGRVNEIAESVGLSPASLFRSARTLERSLGKPLFDRTAQGVIPTKTGETLARELRRALREIEMARGEIHLASGRESLEVTVGALPMAGSHDLALATHAFMSQFPQAKVRLFSGEYHKLLADLSNSRIDMIFGVLRQPDWAEDLNEDFLFEDHYALVMRPGHPLLRLDQVTPDALAGHDWIVPQPGTPRRKRIDAIFDASPRRPRFQVETPSLALIRAFLVNTDTVTLMARSEVQADLDQGILAALPCPGPETILPKGVTTRADWLPTQAHSAFLDCLRDVTQGVRPGADLLAG